MNLNFQTNYVFVVDAEGKPLKPCKPSRARILQAQGKAKRLRTYPFTLILDKTVIVPEKTLELRIDPGSKYTGLALVDIKLNAVIWAMELSHRSEQIKVKLQLRKAFRRNRRSRIRHRQARLNRKKGSGWLAPSLLHRVESIFRFVEKIIRYAPVKTIAVERVKFDFQLLENPDISGIEYQQGTLAGYTLREALLEKWGRECSYCGQQNIPLEIEHIKPKSKGGSKRFSNLCLACNECNRKKGNQDVEEFLHDKPSILNKIKNGMKKSFNHASAVNSTRNKLVEVLEKLGLPIIYGNGALTKMTRIKNGLPKAHWIDAANVAGLPVILKTLQPLIVKSTGHGNRQYVRHNDSGFPTISNLENAPERNQRIVIKNGKPVMINRKRVKKNPYCKRIPLLVKAKTIYKHVSAGDIVKMTIPIQRKRVEAGVYTVRVKTPTNRGIEAIVNGFRVTSNKFKPIHLSDGYDYQFIRINSDLLQVFAT